MKRFQTAVIISGSTVGKKGKSHREVFSMCRYTSEHMKRLIMHGSVGEGNSGDEDPRQEMR